MDEAGAAAGDLSRADVEQALIRKSREDESFRGRLLAEPKATIEQELGEKLPAELEVRMLEETPNTLYLVLPTGGTTRRSSDELSDVELDTVAGGGTFPTDDLRRPPL